MARAKQGSLLLVGNGSAGHDWDMITRDLGYRFTRVRTPGEALRQLAARRVVAVVVDLSELGSEGETLVHQLRERNDGAPIPIVVLRPSDGGTGGATTPGDHPFSAAGTLPGVHVWDGALTSEQLRNKLTEVLAGKSSDSTSRSRRPPRLSSSEPAASSAPEGSAWLQGTLASIGDAVITTDPQGRVTYLNPVAEQLTGWRREEAVGLPLVEIFPIIHATSRAPVENPVAKVIRSGGIVGLANHTLLIAKDGTERPIDDSAAPIRDANGRTLGVVLVFRDVTEERRAARELQASETRKTAIVETALDCIVTIDHHGRLVEFNPAAERTFGYTRDQVLGQSMAELIIPPAYRDAHHQGLARYLATGEGPVLNRRIELIAMRSDGSEFPVELAIAPIVTEGPVLFTAYLRDISAQRMAEGRRNVRLAVTQILAEADSLAVAAPRIVQVICESLHWDFGSLWTRDPAADVLRCAYAWHSGNPLWAQFEELSRTFVFRPGVGLPGRVWRARAPAWIPDAARDGNFPRAAGAAQIGLQSAFAIPVQLGNQCLGVLEFFSRQIRQPDVDLLEMMGTVGSQIGQFIERHQALERLRESERRFAGFMQHLAGLAWIKDHQGRYVYANAAAQKTFGYSEQDLYGKTDDELFPPETARQFRAHDQQAASSETGVQVIETLQHDDGLIHSSIVSKFPIFRADGGPVWIGGMAIDITDRLRAEHAVRHREEQLHLLIDALPALVSYVDSDRRYRILNRQYEVWFGRPRDEACGKHLHEALGDKAYEFIRPHLEAALGGREVTFEGVVPYRDGPRHVRATYIPDRDSTGKVQGFFSFVTDITQQKRIEAAYRFLAEASSTLAAVVDYESTLRKVARLAVPFFADWCVVDMVESDGSLRRLEVVHADPSRVELAQTLHRDHPPRIDDQYGAANVVRTGKPEMAVRISDEILQAAARDAEHLAVLRDLALVSYISVPLVARGVTLGVITFITSESGREYGDGDLALAHDLADRAAVAIDNARLYAELREADRLKDEFLAMLAHELRNPLAPIRNALHVMKMPGADPPILEQVQDMAERQVQHMARLLDDLLDVSRISRGKIELRKELIDVVSVANRTVEAIRSLIEDRFHRLTIELPAEPLRIEGDPTRLEQIFTNLLNNAAKYTDPGGLIVLSIVRDGNWVVVRVRDNGIGIAGEMLPRIFDLFVQAERRLDRSQGGVGIGLTLVRRLVELHDGTIEAFSAGLGEGSEFVVRFPLASNESRSSRLGDGLPAIGGSIPTRRILVVDDNHDAADSLAMMLRLTGQKVRAAYSGSEALQAVDLEPFDLIFLDIGMPGMDGYEVAARIRRNPKVANVTLIAMTGWGQEEDRRRTRQAGFHHHLVKPVEPATLQKFLLGELNL